jgi:hypothetical protein
MDAILARGNFKLPKERDRKCIVQRDARMQRRTGNHCVRAVPRPGHADRDEYSLGWGSGGILRARPPEKPGLTASLASGPHAGQVECARNG